MITPGPWMTDGTVVYSLKGVGKTICQCHVLDRDVVPEFFIEGEAESNAILIAAAPDLLAVAEMVLSLATVETPKELVDAAQAALLKAKGEVK